MSKTRLRIVSDLHVGEPHSRLKDVRSLASLFDDAAHLVLNGDTIDTRFLELDPLARQHKEALDELAAAHSGRLTVVTGNHDPNISPIHHLDLEDGRLLVTHGDTLFPTLAPWGWEARFFQAEQERRMAQLPEAQRGFWERRVQVCKEASFAIRHLSPHRPGKFPRRWAHVIHTLRTMTRAHRVWLAWRAAPEAAVQLAETYRPAARIIVIGHVHRPGVWRVRGRTVINTGSATPPGGALAVDFVGRQLHLRQLSFSARGPHLGRVRQIIDLDAAFAPLNAPPVAPLPPAHEC